MAWQLIYTSAPRLLEAGRSGFGTVARHREIPPLVVAAVERISQFSRQAGLDAGRIIHAHRVISVSGQRFHVLSCIRDAGADYTGRTNHIAHHLIAEPQEIAALGNSAADVSLQMPWLESWSGLPRWLELHETIPLASFPSSTSDIGAGWGAVTGDPRHAQLLASGEAADGCYLIVPAGTDLRPLLAESLRLARERRWQMAFTTSLQPSDEPTDFRWSGIEAASPLRGTLGTSGRIVLDLTRPDTLPVPSAPSASFAPAIPRTERAIIPTRSPLPEPAAAVSAERAPASIAPVFSDARWARRKENPVEPEPVRSMPRKYSIWPWALGAAAILIIASVGGTVIYRRTTIKTERANLVARLPDFARKGAKGEIALDGIRWSTHDKAKALVAAADAISDQLQNGTLDNLDPEPLKGAADNAEAAGMNVSAYREVWNLASHAVSWRDEAGKPKPRNAALEPDNALLEKLTALFFEKADFKASQLALQQLWVVREADAIWRALDGNSDQKLSLNQFRDAIEELDQKKKSGAQVASLEKARSVVNDWNEVTANKSPQEKDSWPRWLRDYAHQSSFVGGKPVAKPVQPPEGVAPPESGPKIVTYLAVDLEHLRQLTVPESGTQVKYRLTEDGAQQTLVVFEQSIKKSPFQPVLFSIDPARQVLTPEEGARTLRLPATLLICTGDENAKPLAEIRILGGKTQEPILPPQTSGLARNGENLLVDLSFAPRTTAARWFIQVPDAPADQFLPIENGVAQLGNVLRGREQAVGDWQARLQIKQRSLTELTDPKALEDKLSGQCAELESLFSGATGAAKSTGDVLPRLGDLLKRASNQVGELAEHGQNEELFRCGVALVTQEGSLLKPGEAVAKASTAIQGMFGFKNETLRQKWKEKLEKLKVACATAAAFLSMGSEESKREKTKLMDEIAEIEKRLASLKIDPWQDGKLPKGDYPCIVEAGGQRVTVTLFQIP